jgi:hypothetical protein
LKRKANIVSNFAQFNEAREIEGLSCFDTAFIDFEFAAPYDAKNVLSVPACEADAAEGNRPEEHVGHVLDASGVPIRERLVEGKRVIEHVAQWVAAHVEWNAKLDSNSSITP